MLRFDSVVLLWIGWRAAGEEGRVQLLDCGPTEWRHVTLGVGDVRQQVRVVAIQPRQTAIAVADLCETSETDSFHPSETHNL